MRPMTVSWRMVALSFVLVVSSLAVAGVAQAAFPGKDGKVVYQSDRTGKYQIYTINSNGTDDTRITTNTAFDTDPAWSPDGTQIVFTSNRDGNNEIYKMNANGTNQVRLTTNAADDKEPAWSGDGTQIAFASTRTGGVFHIFKMNADGTGVTQITSGTGADTSPAWSPDGTKIAFETNRDGNPEIYKMNPTGTGLVNLTARGASDRRPAWAPHGTQIAFDSDLALGNDDQDVWVMGADGSGASNVTGAAAGFQGQPYWAPSTSYVFFPQPGYVVNSASTFGTDQIAGLTSNASNNNSPDQQPVSPGYARPRGATPLRIPLVEVYNPCSYPNTFHRGTINTYACNPPSASSAYLTVGTPNANGQAANSIGTVVMRVICVGLACEDGDIVISMSDVRCSGTSGGCSGGFLSDYVGSLYFTSSAQVTDQNSVGSGGATVGGFSFGFPVPCSSTTDMSTGSFCSAHTTLNAQFGGSNDAIVQGTRAIWQLGPINVSDGGADGVGSTADNTQFAAGGLFFP